MRSMRPGKKHPTGSPGNRVRIVAKGGMCWRAVLRKITIIRLALRDDRFTIGTMKTLLLLLALCVPCFARLGDNLKQLTDRFGQPTKIIRTPLPDMIFLLFEKADIKIMVGLLNGASADESYEVVTEAQAAEIMAAVSAKWEPDGERKGSKMWHDGTINAYLKNGGSLFISTKEAREAVDKITQLEEEKKAKDERAAVKGF